jgi:hypothetical protein
MDARADRIAIFIALVAALLIGTVFLGPLVSCFYHPHEDEPLRVPLVKEAGAIALAEVEKREGWPGVADTPAPYHVFWQVVVRRKPGPTRDWRWVTINSDRTVVGYEARTDPLP